MRDDARCVATNKSNDGQSCCVVSFLLLGLIAWSFLFGIFDVEVEQKYRHLGGPQRAESSLFIRFAPQVKT